MRFGIEVSFIKPPDGSFSHKGCPGIIWYFFIRAEFGIMCRIDFSKVDVLNILGNLQDSCCSERRLFHSLGCISPLSISDAISPENKPDF